MVFGPCQETEYFINWGRGFHSNDARGTLAGIDPKTGDALQSTPGLVRSRGLELGLRSEIISKMQTSLALYRLAFARYAGRIPELGS